MFNVGIGEMQSIHKWLHGEKGFYRNFIITADYFLFHSNNDFPHHILTNKNLNQAFSDILAQKYVSGRLAHVLLIWFKNLMELD